MKARIITRQKLCPDIFWYEISAPHVACRFQAGQFVIIQVHERGERIPLTVAEAHPERGTIVLVFQVVGKTTLELSLLKEGEEIENCVGPLGNPSEINFFGQVICVGGGTGIACLLPIVRALSAAGNEVISLIGSRSRDYLILEDKIKAVSSSLFIATDDGTRGERGLVTDVLERILEEEEVRGKIQRVIAIGPPLMMRKVAEITRPHRIKTIVSLNTIMVDGTGMCGSCRVFLGKAMKLACIDGPEFDAHRVNFDDVISRLEMFRAKERLAWAVYRQQLEARQMEIKTKVRAKEGTASHD